MRELPYDGLTLFGRSASRKYLNAAERRRFVEAARRMPSKIRLFRLTLRWSDGYHGDPRHAEGVTARSRTNRGRKFGKRCLS